MLFLVKNKIFKTRKGAIRFALKINYPVIFVGSKKRLEILKRKNLKEDEEIEKQMNGKRG